MPPRNTFLRVAPILLVTLASAVSAQPLAPPAPQPVAPAPQPVALPEPALPEKAAAEKPKSGRFEIATEDGASKLEVRALIHADARFFTSESETNTFALRRVRPSLDGRVARYFDFKLQSDLAGSRLQILDAYANLHFIDEVQLRAGKGKPPVGLERLQSPSDITFAERAFPTLLVPNRDVGVQLHGVLFEGAVEYAVGLYNGVPNGQSGDVDSNDGKDVVGRVFVQPFLPLEIEPLAGLGLGFAALTGKETGALGDYRSAGQTSFFAYPATSVADGRRVVLAPQAYYSFGPVAALFEYVRVRERLANDMGNSGAFVHTAWQIAASGVLGGKPSHRGVKVDAPLDPKAGSWGAVELGARYSELALDGDVLDEGLADPAAANEARAWALGLTWHFANRVRALVNYEHTTYQGGAATGDRDAESLVVSRMQLAF